MFVRSGGAALIVAAALAAPAAANASTLQIAAAGGRAGLPEGHERGEDVHLPAPRGLRLRRRPTPVEGDACGPCRRSALPRAGDEPRRDPRGRLGAGARRTRMRMFSST